MAPAAHARGVPGAARPSPAGDQSEVCFRPQAPLALQGPASSGVGLEGRGARRHAVCNGPINISCLEAVPFHKDGEQLVSGDEMMRRARDAKNFPGCSDWSQHHAEQLLLQAAELPKEWACESGPALLFPDTVLLGGYGSRSVPYLFWGDGQWQLGWGWLGDGFLRGYRFLRLRKLVLRAIGNLCP